MGVPWIISACTAPSNSLPWLGIWRARRGGIGHPFPLSNNGESHCQNCTFTRRRTVCSGRCYHVLPNFPRSLQSPVFRLLADGCQARSTLTHQRPFTEAHAPPSFPMHPPAKCLGDACLGPSSCFFPSMPRSLSIKPPPLLPGGSPESSGQ